MMRPDRLEPDSGAIPPAAISAWLKERERFQRECGCGAGAVGAGLGFVAIIAWLAAHAALTSAGAVMLALAELVGATVLGAVLGKLAGLARARYRFQRATLRLLGNETGVPGPLSSDVYLHPKQQSAGGVQ
jgi:hypothetical protein